MNRPCHVFVAGLHRSGTSLLTRLLAAHPDIAAITGAPVPEQEGCYLQGAIPHTARHGRPGHFATDPAQRHDESSIYNSLQTRQRLDHDWNPWFGPGRWRIEKSPVNLTRMRLYQQLFPMAHFIVIQRHPECVAAAHAKWCDRSAAALIDHCLDAQRLVDDDIDWLHAVVRLRYEDLVRHPAAMIAMLCAFLDIPAIPVVEPVRDGNADYAAQAVSLTAEQEERASGWGYRAQGGVDAAEPLIRHPLRARRDASLAAWQRR